MDRKCPYHTHTGTEVSPTSLRHCREVRDLVHLHYNYRRTVSFYSLSLQTHPTVSHVEQGSGREKEGKLLHALRQPSSPQSVLMWFSSSLCVSITTKNRKRGEKESKEGGRVFPRLNGFLYSLDCSIPIIPLRSSLQCPFKKPPGDQRSSIIPQPKRRRSSVVGSSLPCLTREYTITVRAGSLSYHCVELFTGRV